MSRFGVRVRPRLVGITIAFCALVPVAFAASDRSVENEGFSLSAQDRSNGSAKCKQGTHATGAGFARQSLDQFDYQVYPVSVYPFDDLRRWYAAFDNKNTTSRDATVFVLCRDGGPLKAKTKEYTVGSMGGNQPTLKAKCKRGSSLAGGGVLLTGGYNTGHVVDSRPAGKRTWRADLFITTSAPSAAYAFAMCDPDGRYKQIKETAQADSFPRAEQRTNFDTVTATAKCPNGYTTTAGGWELDGLDPNASTLASFPLNKDKWTSTARYAGALDPELTSYAICRKD